MNITEFRIKHPAEFQHVVSDIDWRRVTECLDTGMDMTLYSVLRNAFWAEMDVVEATEAGRDPVDDTEERLDERDRAQACNRVLQP